MNRRRPATSHDLQTRALEPAPRLARLMGVSVSMIVVASLIGGALPLAGCAHAQTSDKPTGPKSSAKGPWFVSGKVSRRSKPPQASPIALRFADANQSPHAEAIDRAVGWLTNHVVRFSVNRGDGKPQPPLKLIAWHDGSVSKNPRHRVAYLLTDNLWAAWALKPIRPRLAAQLNRSLKWFGFATNGYMDNPMHRVNRFLPRCIDDDPVHGTVLARAKPASSDTIPTRETSAAPEVAEATGTPEAERPAALQVRVMRYAPAGSKRPVNWYTSRFSDALVYRAFFDYWHGRQNLARRRLLGCLKHDPGPGEVFYDAELGLFIDAADWPNYQRFQQHRIDKVPYAPFKQALFLFAFRVMGIEDQANAITPNLTDQLERALLSAQTRRGGFAHMHLFNPDHPTEHPAPNHGSTAETTSITIMALLAQPINAPPPSPPSPK